jgi:hypothetical protein
MTMSSGTKHDTHLGRYPIFAITVGIWFSILYLFVMAKGWPLFTYYPAVNKWTLFTHPAGVPSAGPAMKWYGFVATTSVISLAAGVIACILPESLIKRIWWPGLIWVVPILAMVVVLWLILGEGD